MEMLFPAEKSQTRRREDVLQIRYQPLAASQRCTGTVPEGNGGHGSTTFTGYIGFQILLCSYSHEKCSLVTAECAFLKSYFCFSQAFYSGQEGVKCTTTKTRNGCLAEPAAVVKWKGACINRVCLGFCTQVHRLADTNLRLCILDSTNVLPQAKAQEGTATSTPAADMSHASALFSVVVLPGAKVLRLLF